MSNICSLNSSGKHCLPSDVIKNIYISIIPKEERSKNTNNPISIIAEKTKCDSMNCDKEKELCIVNKLKKNKNDKEIADMAKLASITYFKPTTKDFDHNYWLNNTEIDNIQHQLYNQFEGYYYSNIHMIDLVMIDPKHKQFIEYDVHPLTELNFVNELKESTKLNHNGKLKYYGVVINTDISSNSGLHWFSIFIDFTVEPYTIEYFNSSGYDIKNQNFKKFFINLADEISFNCSPCKFVKVTDIQHQSAETANCGSYALYYIWERLNGKPFSYFANNKIDDEKARSFREFLFRLK